GQRRPRQDRRSRHPAGSHCKIWLIPFPLDRTFQPFPVMGLAGRGSGVCPCRRIKTMTGRAAKRAGEKRLARLLEFTLNGRNRADAVADNMLLLDFLREQLGLTGTKT